MKDVGVDDGNQNHGQYDLRVEDMAMLHGCRFTTRRPVLGHYTGRHASPLRGQSVEFADYREYLPGDDVSAIDWKVYGRSDKLFVRLFEHQSDMTVRLMVDASASMQFAGISPKQKNVEWATKYDHACRLASAIAWVVTRQQDRVGLGLASGGLATSLPARSSMPHMQQVLRMLKDATPRGVAGLASALRDMAEGAGRRGVLVVCSDLHEPMEPILESLDLYLHRGYEAIVFHVLHADELSLPDIGEALFVDSETGAKLRVNIADVRADYETRLTAVLERWASALVSRGIDHNIASTAEPIGKILGRYLRARESSTGRFTPSRV